MLTPEEEIKSLREQNLELLRQLDEAQKLIIEIEKKNYQTHPKEIIVRQIAVQPQSPENTQ